MVRLTIKLVKLLSYSAFFGVGPFFMVARAQAPSYFPKPTADAFRQRADEALAQGDTTGFKKANRRALELARYHRDSLILAEVYWNYGAYHLTRQGYDSAYYFYHQSKVLYEAIPHPYYEAKMLYNMAYIKSKIKDYAGSEALAIEAVTRFQKLGKPQSLYQSFNLLGVIFEELHEYDKAIHYLQRAQQQLKESGPSQKWRDRAGIYNNLGIIYQKKNDQDRAIGYFKQALAWPRLKRTDPQLYARLTDNLAFSRFLRGDSLHVYQDMKKALRLRDSLGHIPGQIISHLHLAHYWMAQHDTLAALPHAQLGLQLAHGIQLNRDLLNAYQLLGRLLPKQARYYFEQYAELEQRIQLEERKVKNNFARIQYETGTYIAQNKALTTQNILLWAGVAFLLLVSIFIYFLIKQRQKNKILFYEHQQSKAQEKIYGLQLQKREEWENGRKQERERLAEELHDGILSKLFGLRLQWGYLAAEEASPKQGQHEQNLKQLGRIEREIRSVAYDLKSEILQEPQICFYHLLQQLIQEKEKAYGIAIHLHTSAGLDWEQVATDIKINLYRILEESLKNAYHHARCSRVQISFRVNAPLLHLTITDNGRGFPNPIPNKGLGLQNLENRVKKMKGRFWISPMKSGAQLELEIPLKP